MTFTSNTRSSLRRVLLAMVLGSIGLMTVAANASAEYVYYDAPPQTNIDRSRPDEFSKTARYIACLTPNTSYSFNFSARTEIRDEFEGPGEFRTSTTGTLTGVSVTPASFARLTDNMNIDATVRFTTGASTEIPSEIKVRLVLLTPNGFHNPNSLLRLIIPRVCPTPPPPPTTTTEQTVTTDTVPTVTTDTVPTVTTETEPTVTTEGTVTTPSTTEEPPTSVKVAGNPVAVTTATVQSVPVTTAASTICKASSRSVKVRGKRSTTISVKLDKPNQTVNLSGAGINKTIRSGSNGKAVLKVTPRRSGTVRATGDQCALVLSATVKTKKIPSRKTERRIKPRFTG